MKMNYEKYCEELERVETFKRIYHNIDLSSDESIMRCANFNKNFENYVSIEFAKKKKFLDKYRCDKESMRFTYTFENKIYYYEFEKMISHKLYDFLRTYFFEFFQVLDCIIYYDKKAFEYFEIEIIGKFNQLGLGESARIQERLIEINKKLIV